MLVEEVRKMPLKSEWLGLGAAALLLCCGSLFAAAVVGAGGCAAAAALGYDEIKGDTT